MSDTPHQRLATRDAARPTVAVPLRNRPRPSTPAEPAGPVTEADTRRLRILVQSVRRDVPALAAELDQAVQASLARTLPEPTLPRVEQWVTRALLAVSAPEKAAAEGIPHSANVGAGSARYGIPLDAMLRLHRLGTTRLWSALADSADSRGEAAKALLKASGRWWKLQDSQLSAMVSSYHATAVRMSPPLPPAVTGVLDDLLERKGTVRGLRAAADTLGLPVQGKYVVAVVVKAAGAARGRYVGPSGGPGMKAILWRRRPGQDVAVILLDGQPPDQLDTLLPASPHARIGISPVVDDLGGVHRARRLAEIAAQTCLRAGEVAVLDERLPEAVVAANPEVAVSLADQVFGRLADLEPAHRDLLMETLGVWLESGGSADVAGRRLHCHRNTVMNRLHRIERLTEHELVSPRGLVRLALALHAHRQNTATAATGGPQKATP